ncbi:MAG TPA: hypothetical protein VKM94_05195 [Blastocatellia bacterium]|nr:hypothetical protein [Blastocatellia bacterium]
MPARSGRRITIGNAAFLILIFSLWSSASGQQPARLSADSNSLAHQLHVMTGRALSQGKNQQPVGELRLKTYLLEELELSQPVRIESAGKTSETSTCWRLTIIGESFTPRAMPAMVWVNGKLIGLGVESADLTRITVLVFDRALLIENGSIEVGYGESDRARTSLPERLTLSSAR